MRRIKYRLCLVLVDNDEGGGKVSYIYIMKNSALNAMIKISYATYDVFGHLEDKKLHRFIDQLYSDPRVSRDIEFFGMFPEDAYELLEAIATISGTTNELKRKIIVGSVTKQTIKNPPIDFHKCGLKYGEELVFTEDPSIKVAVASNRKVPYNNELTSLPKLAGELEHINKIQGTLWFTYNGEQVVELAKRTRRNKG